LPQIRAGDHSAVRCNEAGMYDGRVEERADNPREGRFFRVTPRASCEKFSLIFEQHRVRG
jgi:hypothetical protein